MFIAVFLVGLVLDQLSKWFVHTHMLYQQSIPIIKNIFHLTYTRNTGAAWSMLSGHSWLFIILAVFVVGVILYVVRQIPKEDRLLRGTLGAFAAGALGNMIDRVARGWVVDFFDFRIFPVFNIADCLIVISVILLIWQILFQGKLVNEYKGKKEDEQAK